MAWPIGQRVHGPSEALALYVPTAQGAQPAKERVAPAAQTHSAAPSARGSDTKPESHAHASADVAASAAVCEFGGHAAHVRESTWLVAFE